MSGPRARGPDVFELHSQLLRDLGDVVEHHGDIATKPLLVQMSPPLPRSVRFYVYTATNPPGERAAGDFKVQLMLPGMGRDGVGSFDFSDGIWAMLVGYIPSHQVYVLWDAGCHDGFVFSSNVQVHAKTVYAAQIRGTAQQTRRLRRGGGHCEVVLAARGDHLRLAIAERILLSTRRLLAEGTLR